MMRIRRKILIDVFDVSRKGGPNYETVGSIMKPFTPDAENLILKLGNEYWYISISKLKKMLDENETKKITASIFKPIKRL